MQQTNTNKFNLIESSDAFLPAPLNENMQKVETALSKVETARANTEKKLDQRIAVLEAHRIITGSDSVGYGFVNLGVTPRAVIACGKRYIFLATKEHSMADLIVKEGGFTYSSTIGPCAYMAIV